MTQKTTPIKPSLIERALTPLGLARKRDKARLEAFLNAFPGEYCGFASDETVTYSTEFCDTLGLESVRHLTDVQGKLAPADAAALESLFERLQTDGTTFETYVHNYNATKTFKFSGTRGQDPQTSADFNILWVEDVTENYQQRKSAENKAEEKALRLKQLQAAFNALPQPRWMRNKNGEILWVNNAYSDAVGITISKIISEQTELPANSRKTKSPKDKVLLGKDLAARAREKRANSNHLVPTSILAVNAC